MDQQILLFAMDYMSDMLKLMGGTSNEEKMEIITKLRNSTTHIPSITETIDELEAKYISTQE